jgi:outer membrane lipoprotein-sorting protein
MAFLRRISTKHLILLCAAVVAVAAGGTALAIAAGSGGPKPPAKRLPVALRDALSAPAPPGVTARIEFTNQLVDASGIHGSNPLLTGAQGRLWASADGFRLELQASGGADAQVVSDGNSFWIYDGSSNTVYRGQLPQERATAARSKRAEAKKPLTLARIKSALAKLAKHATVSAATPDNVAGQPAYSVSLSPRGNGGLLDSAALAWDAARGVPLRLGVYAKGRSAPVLELKATDISYGPVARSDIAIAPPAGAKTVNLSPAKAEGRADKAGKRARTAKPVAGLAAAQRAVRFKLAAPSSLGGMRRQEVRLLGGRKDKNPTVLVTYGQGLGAIAVLQHTAKATTVTSRSAQERNGPLGGLELPKVSINGAAGQELDTALGTVIRFERGGVSYTVLGSVPPATALAAARGL